MIKVEFGKIEMKGVYGELLANTMTICDKFIGKTMDEFGVDEAKAINGFLKMVEIVKDNFHELRAGKVMEQINDLFDYLVGTEGESNVIAIEVESTDDVTRLLEAILKGIRKGGDE